MPDSTALAALPGSGELRIMPARDLTVLTHIQREPTTPRLRQMAREWQPTKVGMLFVAHITDGPHRGVNHVYDGGTRWRVAKDHLGGVGQPDYPFACWIKEMTEQEAAEAFLTFNTESRRPSAYAQYLVAIQARQEWALAIERACNAVGVTVDQHTTATKLSAVRAAERIVLSGYSACESGEESDEPSTYCWRVASDHLIDVLRITMAAFRRGGDEADSYDADIIQAVARIVRDNPHVDRARLAEALGYQPAGAWRNQAQRARETYGGSVSRSLYVKRSLVDRYNLRLRSEGSRLRGGTPREEDVA